MPPSKRDVGVEPEAPSLTELKSTNFTTISPEEEGKTGESRQFFPKLLEY